MLIFTGTTFYLKVFTEHIRLTDDKAVELFTEEDGDLFQWFKHQAAQGVVSAQVHYFLYLLIFT